MVIFSYQSNILELFLEVKESDQGLTYDMIGMQYYLLYRRFGEI